MRWKFLIMRCAAATIVLSASATYGQKAPAPYDAVDPFIGTAGGGNTFPGATLPFGMVQWSPDTNQDAWYRHDDKTVYGFSLTHISGAGCPLYGDFAVLPVADALAASPGTDIAAYAQGFDHSSEQAHPGFYAVTLASGVRVEITVAERAGIARFTFPSGSPARLLVNAGSSTHGLGGEGRLKDSLRDNNTITLSGQQGFNGSSHAGHFCSSDSHYIIHVAGAFDKPFKTSAVWQDHAILGAARTANGHFTGAWLDFGDVREVTLKVGVSFVSDNGARGNLGDEIPGWNFDAVARNAHATWDALLDRFATTGGTDAQRTIFYTGVYHSFLHPNLFSDEDGQYTGFDHQTHTVTGTRQKAQYANFSDWDIYRNTVQLQALFFPDRSSDMMQSLVNDAAQGGQLPRWAAANDVTYVMGGDSPTPVIASAYSFGARNFDTETALKYMVKATTQSESNRERPFLKEYLALGYVPSEKDRISASRTLEYASDDFSIAEFAKALHHTDVAERFARQSQSWKNLLDPETGWIRPRLSDGTWVKDFDAERSMPKGNGSDQLGFEEGNTWQYSFMIPFDYPALFAAIGGDSAVTPRLDKFFVKLRCWGQPCYNIENEPDFVAPFAYVFAGQPWKTQEVVTRIGKETFKTTPDGIPGNDDLGATSGVYVWNALGFYPAVPGVGGLIPGTPMFTNATLQLAQGRTVEIRRSGDGIYVKQMTLDRAPYLNQWLPLEKLHAGTTKILFTMQETPDTQRGSAPADRPPSFRDEQAMEFSDQPHFSVAGVTDWTAAGGHGSDTTLRTSESLAIATSDLKSRAGSAAENNLATAHRLTAEADERRGDPFAAVQEFERAATIEPSEQNEFEWASELLLHRAIWQAEAVFRKGAEAYPKSLRMQAGLGAALFAGARYEDAAVQMCKASDLDPAEPEPYLLIGKISVASPNPVGCAESKLARFVQLHPESPAANYLYAMAILKAHPGDQKSLELSKKSLNKAVSLDPKCSEAYLELGILAAAEHDNQSAIGYYVAAIKGDPNFADPHYRLGVIYDRVGEQTKAAQEFALHKQIEQQQAEATEAQRKAVKQFLFANPDNPAAASAK